MARAQNFGAPTTAPVRVRRWLRVVRRTVLARRRLLAAILAAAAVTLGLRLATAPPPPTVPVLVARNDIPAGAVLARSDLVTAAFAPDTQPTGVAETWVGRILAAPLRRGEPVTDVRLVGPSLTDGYPGLVAAPVRLPDPGAVALLSVGDRVDLYAAHPRSGAAKLLVPRAMVLALPAPEPADTASGALTGRLVVLGVDETDVGVIADAAVQDFLTFSFAR